MDGTDDDQCIAGLVATLGSYGTYTFKSCSNEADVYASDLKCVGGLVGYAGTANTSFTDCINSGAISTDTVNKWARVSGILGGSRDPAISFTNCSNTGTLSTYNGQTFDIAGGGE
jgi:hypothetical protein